MVTYVCLIQFQDQGIRNIKDTVKRERCDRRERDSKKKSPELAG